MLSLGLALPPAMGQAHAILDFNSLSCPNTAREAHSARQERAHSAAPQTLEQAVYAESTTQDPAVQGLLLYLYAEPQPLQTCAMCQRTAHPLNTTQMKGPGVCPKSRALQYKLPPLSPAPHLHPASTQPRKQEANLLAQ